MNNRWHRSNRGNLVIGTLRPLLLILLFALWWGGLTFYALIVVPIGSDVTSIVEQGFVTQRVTLWHNLLLTVVTICVVAEAFFRRSGRWWLLSVSLLFVNIALVVMHWTLSGMVDVEEFSVPTEFYRLHAVYLWLTTAEWLIGLAGAILMVFETTTRRSEKVKSG